MNLFAELKNLCEKGSKYLKKTTFLDLTSWSILVISAFGFAAIITLYFKQVTNVKLGNSAQSLILWITAISIFLYTRETRDLKRVTQKQLEATRDNTKLLLMPLIRIEWSQVSNYDNPTRVPGLHHIKIINEGSGIAVNVKITFSHRNESYVVNILGANKTYLPITEPNYEDFGFANDDVFVKNLDPSIREYSIFVEYLDINKGTHKQEFESQKLPACGYKLIKW
ncbi:MAG TPA: hypothetical protein VMQ44_02025 [Candidatus Saccharimonadales bacterium]|nr:hypothetical protein [Candidatus Saccharimonadales bacterium]